MKNIEIRSITQSPEKFLDQEVCVAGWIKTSRSSKQVGFIELNDGSQFNHLQIVFDNNLENFEAISKLPLSSSIQVFGKLVLTPEAKQPFEIQANKIELLFEADRDYPLQKKRHSFEFLRSQLHLRGRTNTFMAVFRVRSVLAQAIHDFFQSRGYVYMHTPIITGTDAEGAGEMFQVTHLPLENLPMEESKVDYSEDFFGRKVGLTVSGQLAVEPFALSFGKVYTFGPTFRAENSNTLRHAAEFWMIEPEISFCDLEQCLDVIEAMMKFMIERVLEKAPQEMAFFNARIDPTLLERLQQVLQEPFARVTYTEAVKILEEAGDQFEFKPYWGCDLQTEHEKYLSGTHFGKPVFVTDYPREIKAFYMKQNPDGKTVRASDLLVPVIGEIVGGSQREDDYQVLHDEILRRGMNLEDYEWYLDLRRYGSIEHSGFGLGFERMVQYVTGMANIRDVIPYPRTPGHADF